jgi:hypothetical protein
MCHFISTSWTSTSSSNSKFTIKFGFKFKNSNMKRKEKERKRKGAKTKLLHGPKPLPRSILAFSSAWPKFYSTACAADWRVPVASHPGLSPAPSGLCCVGHRVSSHLPPHARRLCGAPTNRAGISVLGCCGHLGGPQGV